MFGCIHVHCVCVCEVIFSTSMSVIMVIYTVQYLTDKDECTV